VSKGSLSKVPLLEIDGQRFRVRGRPVATASLQEEWYEDLRDPGHAIHELRRSRHRVDLLTFWQRPPETEPRYGYYHEWVDVAAIPITTYERWWNEQIGTKTRNMVRKPSKRGVVIAETPFTDELVAGITAIFNQAPVRRGKRFRHYGMTDAETRAMFADRLDDSIFIAAHFRDELIGFFQVIRADRYAMIMMILDKISHRDKSPMNGLMAKAVEICAQRGIPMLTYTDWRRGSHGEFQARNGFERVRVPRYYVALSGLGHFALQVGLHRGIKGALPDWAYERLLALRSRWYDARFARSRRTDRANVEATG